MQSFGMKGISPELSSYLESTRFILPQSKDEDFEETTKLIYRAPVEFLNLVSKAYGTNVEIKIIYSDSIKSEAITINGKNFIVHDRYFGQAISILNRLFLYKASSRSKITYSHKITSQLLSRYGFYEEAIFAAQYYQDFRWEMDHQKKQEQDGTLVHAKYLHIQEIFILLHEHSHLIFKQRNTFKDEISADVTDWLDSYIKKEGESEVLYRSMLSDKTIPKIEREFISEHFDSIIQNSKLNNKFCKEIQNRKDLLEEFCCDRLAIVHILPYIEQSSLERKEAIKAIIICFLHLRAIQLTELRCSMEEQLDFEKRENKLKLEESLYFTFYHVRLHHIKDFCYEFLLTSEDDALEVHEEVSSIMNEHSDEILSPMQNVISTLLYDSVYREKMARDFKYIRDNQPEGQYEKRVVSAILHSIPNKQ